MEYDIKPGAVIHGDCLTVLRQMEPDSVDAVITDPPYCSGGTQSATRTRTSGSKYLGIQRAPDFLDSLDQRVWMKWCHEWLSECWRVSKEGSPICVFVDWRQYAALHEALMLSGWIVRGALVWDKGNSRTTMGRFRQDAEFVLWGSKGNMPTTRECDFTNGSARGVYRYNIPPIKERPHQTTKPIDLMCDLVRIVKPRGTILDPFVGSGSTLAAAALTDREYIGIEISAKHHATAQRRALEATKTRLLKGADI